MKPAFPATPLMALNATAIDLETTALEGRSARIVQIGAVHLNYGLPDTGQAIDQIVNPGTPIPQAASNIHGVTDADVVNVPSAEAVLPRLEAFIGERVVLGHNIIYDIAVLRNEYKRIGRQLPQIVTLDVRVLSRLIAPTLAHDGLPQLCEWLGLTCPSQRSAVAGAMATAAVYAALVPKLKERGIRTIAQAIAACAELEPDLVSVDLDNGQAAARTDQFLEAVTQIDSYPYRHRVEELMSQPPLVVDGHSDIRNVLQTILTAGTSSAFVTMGSAELGIVTERDILRAIAERGEHALAMPVSRIANHPLITVNSDEFLYRALARITRHGIRHLAVTDEAGQLVGALTPRSLLRQRASDALVLGEDIDTATNGAELGAAFGRLVKVAQALRAEAVEPRRIANVISAEIAAATRRATIIAEASMAADGWGPPPEPYAVFVMGSVGRGESLLTADQDNAIVFKSGDPGGAQDRWFEELGTRFAKILDDAGIRFCKGGVMAKNAPWRHSLAGWKAVIDSWVRKQSPQDLLNVDIFFDGRAVHGDYRLADEIRNYAIDVGSRSRDFISMLTESTRNWSPPLTLLGAIRTDDADRVDLKKGGLMPIFTAARVIAIKHGSRERATPERFAILRLEGKGSAADIERVDRAHQTLLGAILTQQLRDTEKGIAQSPRVSIEGLNASEKSALKRAIGDVKIAIDLVSEGRF